MNQKKAKALRKLARDCSVGLPQVAYQGEEPKRVRHKSGRVFTLRPTRPPGTRKLEPSTKRAVYRELKSKQP